MKFRYTNKKGVQTWAIIQDRNIDTNDGQTFEATYKGFDIYVSTDNGHGKPTEKDLKRYDIVVRNSKNGGIDVDTWEDLPNLRSAVIFALKGACLIEAREKSWEDENDDE